MFPRFYKNRANISSPKYGDAYLSMHALDRKRRAETNPLIPGKRFKPLKLYRYAAAMPRKSDAFRLAPPTRAPFTSAIAISVAALAGLTDPP